LFVQDNATNPNYTRYLGFKKEPDKSSPALPWRILKKKLEAVNMFIHIYNALSF